MMNPPKRWPQLRELPENEREAFANWLAGSSIPALLDEAGEPLPIEEQDAYYPWDYASWQTSIKT